MTVATEEKIITENATQIVELSPKLGPLGKEFVRFCKRVETELKQTALPRLETLDRIRKGILITDRPQDTEHIDLLFTCSLVLDLVSQGWELIIEGPKVWIMSHLPDEDTFATKEAVRSGHLLGRDAQLREKSVVEFIRIMERRRLYKTGWHSIFSLMRDGKELAEKLSEACSITDPQMKNVLLANTISPYLQFIEGNALCEFTGLRLGDIWRYFRHTWVNEYKSVPGRSVMILIRDAAAPNHPVIGIAALGSSVVQNGLRDKWIGWHPQTFVKALAEHPNVKTGRWLLQSLDALIEGIYLKDLQAEGVCTKKQLGKPNEALIQALLREAAIATKKHHQNPQKDHHKRQKGNVYNQQYWKVEAMTNLYRSKRCRQLAQLLSIRKALQDSGLKTGNVQELKAALESAKVRAAVTQLVRMIKAEHVGIDMMDITVCGAVAPYNLLLGGKLVCMLLCSPEVTQHYRKRYGNQVSIIASSMKGNCVIRKPKLVLLCTTSLYGVGSSQYNRVKIPLEEVGGKEGDKVAFENLGHSSGFGTYHFSRDTIQLGSILISRRKDGRRVNSIFGEGVNPLMRKIREALEHVGLPSDGILFHGNRRVTYGVRLATNFREILLNFDRRPAYLISQNNPQGQTNRITDYWRQRWLSARISRPGILDEVAKNTLTYPITHGAAIPLPTSNDDSMGLFES